MLDDPCLQKATKYISKSQTEICISSCANGGSASSKWLTLGNNTDYEKKLKKRHLRSLLKFPYNRYLYWTSFTKTMLCIDSGLEKHMNFQKIIQVSTQVINLQVWTKAEAKRTRPEK